MNDGCNDQFVSSALGRLVKLEEAVGLVLAHDLTQIIPGLSKGPIFKKGHLIRSEDLTRLAQLGKRHIYVLSINSDQMHENEAAKVMARSLCGLGINLVSPPSEGKVTLFAAYNGLFDLDLERLNAFNLIPGVSCATIHRLSPVKKGQALAATRAIPLIIDKTFVNQACKIAADRGGILTVRPYQIFKTGIVITGNEIASGLIKDRFADIIKKKITDLGSNIVGVQICPDERHSIVMTIKSFLQIGVNLLIITAGMSVDPDDITRLAIADVGARNLIYGAPVLPGNMFLLGTLNSSLGEVIILGVPACALFHSTTIFDLILPRVLTGEHFTREKIAALAHGGFCQNCNEGCRFPVCGFGRGG